MPVKDRISPTRNTYFAEQPLTFLPGLLTPILSASSVLLLGEKCCRKRRFLQDASGVNDSSYLAVVRCGSGSSLLPALLGAHC